MKALKVITTVLIFPALIPFMASFMFAFHTPAHFKAIDSLSEDTLDVWGMKKHRVRNLLVFHLPFWLLLLIRMKLIPRWEKKDDLNQKTG